MILTSMHNSIEFAEVERALMEQMDTVHKKESRHTTAPSRGSSSRYATGSGKGKPYHRQSFIAGVDDMEYPEEQQDNPDEEDGVDDEAVEVEDEDYDADVEDVGHTAQYTC